MNVEMRPEGPLPQEFSSRKFADMRPQVTIINESYTRWLESREPHRRFLFGDGAANTSTDIVQSHGQVNSLAALAREVNLRGSTMYERYDQQQLEHGVETILVKHDKRKHAEGKTVFSLIDPAKDLKNVSALTAGIINIWERAWTRRNKANGNKDNNNPSPFAELPVEQIQDADFERTDVQLVVETAAAVLETLQIGYTSGKIGGHQHNLLSGFIAQRGPDFAMAWIHGDHIRDYCTKHGLDAKRWLSLIPRSIRAYFGKIHPKEPLEFVQRLIRDFDTLDIEVVRAETGLSDFHIIESLIRNPGNPHAAVAARVKRNESLTAETIASAVGWGEKEVKQFFTKSDLSALARGNRNPLQRAEQVVENFDSTLSIENLMTELKEFNLSRKQLTILFSRGRRKKLAFAFSNPLEGAMNTAMRYSVLVGEYPELSELIIANLVNGRSQKFARLVAERIRHEQANRPAGISEKIWAWTIANNPKGTSEQWLQKVKVYIAGYELYMKFLHSRSFDAPLYNDNEKTLYDRTGDTSSLAADPADQITPSDVQDQLQVLAKQAGVSAAEMHMLLDNFGSGDASAVDENSALLSILQRLRLAAGDI